MIRLTENNYAFIDSQNLYKGISSLGWKLDFQRFRIYLKDKYQVTKAFIFIGHKDSEQRLYDTLQRFGYVLIFKPTIVTADRAVKGNCDADLVLQSMIEIDCYDKAVIVSSDGDFYSLVKYLYSKDKLKCILSPCVDNCSSLLRKEGKEKIIYMDNLKKKLEYKKTKGTAKVQNL